LNAAEPKWSGWHRLDWLRGSNDREIEFQTRDYNQAKEKPAMKNSKIQTLWLSVLAVVLLAWSPAFAQRNTAYGTGALASNAGGFADSAFGFVALAGNTTGNSNSAFGSDALSNNTTGSWNSAFGSNALWVNNSNYNSAFGVGALAANTTASENTATGYSSLNNSNSCCNVADGHQALVNVTSGQANTGVGNYAGKTADGSNITGNNNTFLGTGTAASTGSLTNATAIGANAEVEESDALVLGSINGVNGQTATVNVGIGTTTPDSNLTVNGSADKPGGGSWGTYSDGRLKTLHGDFSSGLSQILQLKPVRYRYKQDNAMGIRDTDEHVGLVAQEVQKVIPEAVTKNTNGYLLVNNDPIIWTMLNAIKEQQKEIRDLKFELRATRQSLQKVRAQVAAAQPALVAVK
jgi:trimeric autotransporter adhesin